jgi:hypothetical protein
MPSEIEKYQRDLLASVQQMKRGEAARTTQVTLPEAAEARSKVGCLNKRFPCSWGFPREHCKTGSKVAGPPRGRPRRCCA